MKKTKKISIGGVKVTVEIKKWEQPMKARIPASQTHKSDKWPSRARAKAIARKSLCEF